MSATSAATAYTLEFVRDNLPEGARSVLEVGCGNGELAAVLQANGLRVVALDGDQACVEAARAAGVDARLADWPAEVVDGFDAVLFTRSLHHITPLNGAIDAAVAALRAGGRVIVEDFRIEADSARTKAWFMDLAQSLGETNQLDDAAIERLMEKLDFDEHRNELHSSVAMADALSQHGEVHHEDAAYYFRYLESELSAPDTARWALEQELALIESGEIDALGKRLVLTPIR